MISSYNKPATTISEQIILLKRRGLLIENVTLAEEYLTHVGFFRLADFWQVLQRDTTNNIFIKGTKFNSVVELYNFDRGLRLLLLDAIERIEISLRASITDTMSLAYGGQWYSDPRNAEDVDRFNDNMDFIKSELERNTEEFLTIHTRRYGTAEYPPAWKIVQVLSFGTLSKLYRNIARKLPEKKIIAIKFGLPTYVWLDNWLMVVSALRNHCAHHNRLCYRWFVFIPKELTKANNYWIKKYPEGLGKRYLYTQLCTVKYLLDRCGYNDFSERLKYLIEKSPNVPLQKMGFLPGWENEDLWK
ncbi:Abi family protein [Chitinophaga sp. Cy-1792]|uniref:Abi family protein n=1 Tax=Chitinophaga sp. Cy-1792 TaxID=2608339 RepID=UPI0014216AE5|nr:Abi family protein [Chitinophaga sp. Cy-1792]NIG52929.1 Abi family protein [Chitinophaga sp. Cy-1792]